MYARFGKRILDFILSLLAIVVLSPLLLILTAVGAVAMKGNPFFTQLRPGKKDETGQERIFRLVKFRTMSNAKGKDGNLLPSEQRITRYGRFLRKTSLDELPELFNILKNDMALIGPRPLLVKYLPLYSEEQRHRHDVLPGLTGYAQVNGRNTVTWEDRFKMDIWYAKNITFAVDVKILIETIKVVFTHKGVEGRNKATMEEFKGSVVSECK